MDQIDAFIRQQSQVDLDARIKEEETDPFLKENGEGVKKLWKHVAECGESTFPNPPCLIIAAEWRGARRAEHQSLAHMMQNMWIKATALGHKHLDTTIRYLNVLDDKLREASQEFYRRYSNLYNVNQFLESRR